MQTLKAHVQLICDDSGVPNRFLYANGGGKISFYDCQPSKAESVDEWLLEICPPLLRPKDNGGPGGAAVMEESKIIKLSALNQKYEPPYQ